MKIQSDLKPQDLKRAIDRLFELSGAKIWSIDKEDPSGASAPAITVEGRYVAREWTDWTRGFLHGSAVLQFDATWDESFLRLGRNRIRERMTPQVAYFGVHDHGFNIISSFGNLWRLMGEGRLVANERERDYYELALNCSGSIQAARWTQIQSGDGFIYSFNGPHSLFAPTMRTLRSLALAHRLGHSLHEEQGTRISLLRRLVEHARTTAQFCVYYGEGRDAYDLPGRVSQEAVFNILNGVYRGPGVQQGFSPFTTWMRGLAWTLLGFAELIEFLEALPPEELEPLGGKAAVAAWMLRAARATADFYIAHTPADGIPYWDTGAPGLDKLGDWRDAPADPFNEHEPADSSAATIAAQGLLRLGRHLEETGAAEEGRRYRQAGLTVAAALFAAPYLSEDPKHQGLILHSIFHRPNGWDHVPAGRRVPCGESSAWGDYHARELALYLRRQAENKPYLRFFGA
jgi:hypothetical protein